MNDRFTAHERPQSFGEEIANGVSHAIALVAGIAATPFLLGSVPPEAGALNTLGVSVFAGSMILMYLSSAMYHLLPENKAKRVFQMLDHGAIFALIAGTYTPFTLGVLRGVWGWTLFGVVWTLGILGLILKLSGAIRDPRISTGLYLAMGWLIVIAIRPFLSKVPLPGIFWLLAGGIAYTAGVAFFAAERVRYSHFVWHLFVILGTACHFFAVLWYAA
ncbi:MAG: hemolysin III family protein [Syntrophobacteraceae bacterium]